nr:hypothetical protein [uncultured Pseudomonas sp.]
MKTFLRYFVIIFVINLICKHTAIYDHLNAFLDDTVPAHIDAWSKWLHESSEASAPVVVVLAGLLVPPVIFLVFRAAMGHGR